MPPKCEGDNRALSGPSMKKRRRERSAVSRSFGFCLCQIEPIRLHDLLPRLREVGDELARVVVLRIDLGQSAELRVGAKDEVDAGAGADCCAGCPVGGFKDVAFGRDGLPTRRLPASLCFK